MLIDTHMHLYPTAAAGRRVVDDYPVTEYGDRDGGARMGDRAGTVADGLAALGDAGFHHACVLGEFELPDVPWPPDRTRHWPVDPPFADARDALLEYDRWLCDACAPHPELLPFVTLHPGVLSAADAATHVAALADDAGARGLKLHPVSLRLHPDDPIVGPTMAVCAHRRLPVVVHCGPDRHGAGWSEPAAFAPLLDALPDLRLVLAHLGGAAWRDLAPMAEAYPQLWFDLSEIIAWTGATEAPTADELSALIRRVGPERVLLGSDFPWYEPEDTLAELEALPGLSDEERTGIRGANAARLLDLH